VWGLIDEALLIIRRRPGGYYSLISVSFGLQLGVQARSVIILFMTEQALTSFARTLWLEGCRGAVAIMTLGG
jgi:lipid-binding SYLF domain-containing protein